MTSDHAPTDSSLPGRSIGGRVALVTGAASGMGRATAQLFGQAGAAVAVTDLDAERIDAVVADITDAGGTAHGWVLDVSSADAITEVVGQVRSTLGPIDILVNNAGVSTGGPIDADDYETHWQRALDVNLTPHMRLLRACVDDLARNGDGRVVNIASTEGLGASRNTSSYTAAKHGVIGFTKAMALDLGPRGITVNAICPGPILTAMTDFIPEEQREKYVRRRVPLRRYGDPTEVAQVVLSLVLPAASYITGAAVPVDGGLTAKND